MRVDVRRRKCCFKTFRPILTHLVIQEEKKSIYLKIHSGRHISCFYFSILSFKSSQLALYSAQSQAILPEWGFKICTVIENVYPSTFDTSTEKNCPPEKSEAEKQWKETGWTDVIDVACTEQTNKVTKLDPGGRLSCSGCHKRGLSTHMCWPGSTQLGPVERHSQASGWSTSLTSCQKL